MAIDRIGKGAGLPQTPEAQPAPGAGAKGGASSVETPFKVDRPDTTNPAERAGGVQETHATEAARPLERLRAGEIDVNGYVDLKVDEATHSLDGLSTAELDEIKSVLRDQMKSDPGLADLVRTATGKMPTPPED